MTDDIPGGIAGKKRGVNMLRTLWARIIPKPRTASIVYAIAYAVFSLTGIATLIVPPQSLTGAIGTAGMVMVGSFFLVGGVVGMIAGTAEWWELERWGIAMMTVGITSYAYIVATLHFTSTGSRLTQLGIIIIASLVLVLRLGMIWRYPYKPRG